MEQQEMKLGMVYQRLNELDTEEIYIELDDLYSTGAIDYDELRLLVTNLILLPEMISNLQYDGGVLGTEVLNEIEQDLRGTLSYDFNTHDPLVIPKDQILLGHKIKDPQIFDIARYAIAYTTDYVGTPDKDLVITLEKALNDALSKWSIGVVHDDALNDIHSFLANPEETSFDPDWNGFFDEFAAKIVAMRGAK